MFPWWLILFAYVIVLVALLIIFAEIISYKILNDADILSSKERLLLMIGIFIWPISLIAVLIILPGARYFKFMKKWKDQIDEWLW